jgi:hypothetical protein
MVTKSKNKFEFIPGKPRAQHAYKADTPNVNARIKEQELCHIKEEYKANG